MALYIEHEFTAQGHTVECLLKMYRDLSNFDDIEYSDCIPVIVFTAFSIESYLNAVGFRVADFWSSVERKSWKSKVEILHSLAGKEPNWGVEPLGYAKEIFKLRDKFAHGKPETKSLGPFQTHSEASDHYQEINVDPEWILKLNKKWLVNSKSKFLDVMEYFRGLHDLPENDHLLTEKTEVIEING